jgi:cytochrome c-type biogenesis protein CcmH/NrfF
MQWDPNYTLWLFSVPLLIAGIVVWRQAVREDRASRTVKPDAAE